MPTVWWLRPVSSACARRRAQRGRVEAVELQAAARRAARRVGVAHGPPNALDAPKPTSSSRTIEHVGRAGRRAQRLDRRELRVRVLRVLVDRSVIGPIGDRQNAAVGRLRHWLSMADGSRTGEDPQAVADDEPSPADGERGPRAGLPAPHSRVGWRGWLADRAVDRMNHVCNSKRHCHFSADGLSFRLLHRRMLGSRRSFDLVEPPTATIDGMNIAVGHRSPPPALRRRIPEMSRSAPRTEREHAHCGRVDDCSFDS